MTVLSTLFCESVLVIFNDVLDFGLLVKDDILVIGFDLISIFVSTVFLVTVDCSDLGILDLLVVRTVSPSGDFGPLVLRRGLDLSCFLSTDLSGLEQGETLGDETKWWLRLFETFCGDGDF